MSDNITVKDARVAGFCMNGVRAKCRLLGIDFRSFFKQGYPISKAELIDDAQIAKTVEIARARIQKESKGT